MPKWLKFDEVRLEVFVAAGRPTRGVRAALARPALHGQLRIATQRDLATSPPLRHVRVRVGR
jgi:hypothetical protein